MDKIIKHLNSLTALGGGLKKILPAYVKRVKVAIDKYVRLVKDYTSSSGETREKLGALLQQHEMELINLVNEGSAIIRDIRSLGPSKEMMDSAIHVLGTLMTELKYELMIGMAHLFDFEKSSRRVSMAKLQYLVDGFVDKSCRASASFNEEYKSQTMLRDRATNYAKMLVKEVPIHNKKYETIGNNIWRLKNSLIDCKNPAKQAKIYEQIINNMDHYRVLINQTRRYLAIAQSMGAKSGIAYNMGVPLAELYNKTERWAEEFKNVPAVLKKVYYIQIAVKDQLTEMMKKSKDSKLIDYVSSYTNLEIEGMENKKD